MESAILYVGMLSGAFAMAVALLFTLRAVKLI
jgi:hypothetical protein